jgi:hypothetical protein
MFYKSFHSKGKVDLFGLDSSVALLARRWARLAAWNCDVMDGQQNDSGFRTQNKDLGASHHKALILCSR